MKKHFMLLTVLFFSMFSAKAQTVTVDASSLHCNDIKVVLFTKCTDPAMYTCAASGASNEIVVIPGSVTAYNYGTTSWGTDPYILDPNWDFDGAAVMHICEGTGAPHPLCANADRCNVGGSVAIVGGGTCKPSYPSADCMQYTATCGSCPVGTVINAVWSGGPGSWTLTIY